MRHIVLDTETTGLDPRQGHRIIEIGCVELLHRRKTEQQFHQYINPDREIDAGAFEVHGISNEDLADKPRFGDLAQDFINFIRGSKLIIHNAPFDVGFIDAELALLGPQWGRVTDYCEVIDTLAMAREQHPGKRNSLDELCKRYEIDNSQRQLHGALLDAEILLDVYLAMTSGQEALLLETRPSRQQGNSKAILPPGARPILHRIKVPASEHEAHERRLDAISETSGGICLWRSDCQD